MLYPTALGEVCLFSKNRLKSPVTPSGVLQSLWNHHRSIRNQNLGLEILCGVCGGDFPRKNIENHPKSMLGHCRNTEGKQWAKKANFSPKSRCQISELRCPIGNLSIQVSSLPIDYITYEYEVLTPSELRVTYSVGWRSRSLPFCEGILKEMKETLCKSFTKRQTSTTPTCRVKMSELRRS